MTVYVLERVPRSANLYHVLYFEYRIIRKYTGTRSRFGLVEAGRYGRVRAGEVTTFGPRVSKVLDKELH
jgi:hypothetical protein